MILSDSPRIEMLNMDCMDYLKDARDKQFELAIVDPPYGIDFAKTHTGNGWIVRESKSWDKGIPPPRVFWRTISHCRKSNNLGSELLCEISSPINGMDFLG